MKKCFRIPLLVPALYLLTCIFTACLSAQDFEPRVGQPGKDVIWVPTPEEQAEVMLDLAEVIPADFVIDLGSGDGRIVIDAAKRGATAMGIEFNPDMVALSRRNAEEAGVSDRATFVQADLFESDFSKASVITMYLLPDLNLRLRPKILALEPGTRIVSHSFPMGEWEADKTILSGGRNFYLWIVPAEVDGLWTWNKNSVPATLKLNQNFQVITGTLTSGGNMRPILGAKLRGDQLAFTCGDRYYTGRVTPDGILGSIQSPDNKVQWTATRKLQTEAR
jgi:SAM-dependent methyltransferase